MDWIGRTDIVKDWFGFRFDRSHIPVFRLYDFTWKEHSYKIDSIRHVRLLAIVT
jgi:hypothetical protein